MREYLNVTFSNYVFSESDKKHIVVIQNKYPVVSWEKDDLGFSTTNFKMEVQKDRVFPLRYVDVCGLSSRELTDICSLRKGDKVILLPQNIVKINVFLLYPITKIGRQVGVINNWRNFPLKL